jgi:hypothetical protein
VVDWVSESTLTLPTPLRLTATVTPLNHSQNSSAKEFWFLYDQETLTIVSLRYADKRVRTVLQSSLDIGQHLINVSSITDEYFIGIAADYSLLPFVLSKSGATFFHPQAISKTDLKCATRRIGAETVEDFRGCLQLNEENTSYLVHGTHAPEVFVIGTRGVSKLRLKNHLDVLDGYTQEEEFVFAFRFLENAFRFEIKYFWGLPNSPDTRKTRVHSLDSTVLPGSRLEVP